LQPVAVIVIVPLKLAGRELGSALIVQAAYEVSAKKKKVIIAEKKIMKFKINLLIFLS